MKLIAILLLSTSTLFAQVEIPKKDHKTIMLITEENDSLLYKNFTSNLVDNGYMLENENLERKTFVISYKDFKYLKNFKNFFYFRIKDKTIYITGKWKSNLSLVLSGVSTENSEFEWNYSKSGTNSKMYQEMIEILKNYCETCKIIYK